VSLAFPAMESRSDVEEALAEILWHNIRCIISAIFELGVDSLPWGQLASTHPWLACS
jgi:hypothetical protein